MTAALLFSLFACHDYELHALRGASPELESAGVTAVPEEEAPIEAWIAQAPMYANTAGVLYEVDPLDGLRIRVGELTRRDGEPVPYGAVDIAIDRDGRLFAGFADGSLRRVDPETGALSMHCRLGFLATGMAFTPRGSLLLAGLDPSSAAGPMLLELDPETCEGERVLRDTPFVTSGDLVPHPDGFVYWTVLHDSSTDRLVRIDPETWEIQDLGTLGYPSMYGLGYANGLLFGFTDEGLTIAIDPRPALEGEPLATWLLRSDAPLAWWGATTNPGQWP